MEVREDVGGRWDLMSSIRLLGVHDLPAVVVELPDQGGIGCKGLWSGQLLGLVCPPVATSSSKWWRQ